MAKIFLRLLLAIFFFLTLSGPVLAQAIYKWVDEKGTVHFSDNPASTIFGKQEKRPSDENAIEIAGRLAIGNRRVTEEEMKNYSRGIRLPFTSGQSGGYPSTGSRTQNQPVRRG